MDSYRIGKFAPLFVLGVFCFLGGSAFASFGLGVSIEDGSPVFNSSAIIGGQPYYRYGHVEYEVYAPGGYSGTVGVGGNHYVYAYRVFNNAVSNLSIDAFIVGLAPGLTVSNPGNEGSGVNPSGERNRAGSITYYFDEQVISPGVHSSILLFSSPFGPTYGVADISGEGRNSTVEMVMVPIPEPVSCLFLGMGGICLLKRRRTS